MSVEIETIYDDDIHGTLGCDLLKLCDGDESYSWMKEYLNGQLPGHRARSVTIFVARDEGQVVGWATMHPTIMLNKTNENIPELFYEVSVYVGTAHRGKGYGKELLGAVRHSQMTYRFISFPKDEKGKKAFHNWGIKTFDPDHYEEVTPWHTYKKLDEEYDYIS